MADEDHTRHVTPEEIRVYRNNWWIRSNTVGSDTMLVRHQVDFKQNCQFCNSSKVKRMQLIRKDGEVIPHFGGTGKNPCGILLVSITTKMDSALID